MRANKYKAKLALLDSHALIHRAYHALPPMTAQDGRPTNAAYGFTLMLLKMLTVLRPTHVVAAFDLKGPTFRHREFKAYKAHRRPADQELVAQFGLVRDIIQAFNIPTIARQGYEADDVIGTITKQLGSQVKKIIVTGDKDTLQLVDNHTFVFTLRRGVSDTVLYDTTLVRQRYGFTPALLPDYQGLCGDPTDNIPGVKGIGEKTAQELVSRYGDIDQIYQRLDQLSTRAQTCLKGHKHDALFSKWLATIKRDVPLKFVLGDAKADEFDPMAVRQIFLKLGFKSLISRIPASSSAKLQPTLFSNQQTSNSTRRDGWPDNYHLVESTVDQKKLRQRLSREKVIAFDTETDGLGARKFPLVGVSFAVKTGNEIEAWYVPVNPKTVKAWRVLLENKQVGKVGQNLKYDFEVLAQSNIKLKPIIFDTKLASYLLTPGSRQHSLDTLAAQELGHNNIPITSLIGKGQSQIPMSQVALKKVVPYACEDADIAFRLYEIFRDRIKEAGLSRVLQELELPLIPVLAAIEMAGVKLDRDVLATLRRRVRKRIQNRRQKIWQAAGQQFNINSTQQLRRILYEKLRLPTEGISRTQSGYSTAAAQLIRLEDKHPIIAWLKDYRELTKLQNTYIKTLPRLVDKKTGRLYTSFNQAVTVTGRLSSSDPNLQNIPVRTKLGQEIRAAFVAERGYRLVKADYSQLELRIAAHLSQDEKMIDAFRAGEDIHRSTAAWVHGVDIKNVTDQMRRAAKSLNFGVLYGIGPYHFSREAKVSVEQARSFIERYKQEYSGITSLIAATIEQAREMGYVTTIMGRRRYLPAINSRTLSIRAAAERAAFNFPVQGTAADILKQAMIKLDQHLRRHFPAATIILTVHDELVCEAPYRQAEQLAYAMKETMAQIITLDVPLLVDVAIGRNWRDTRKVK